MIEESGRISTPYDSYGTGPLYMVEKYEEYFPGVYRLVEEKINLKSKSQATFAVNPNSFQSSNTPYYFAVYEGQQVTLTDDEEYRLGAVTSKELDRVYRVNRLDASACNAAQSALDAAISNRDSKQTALNNAQAALNAAAAALPANSSLSTQDVCGKQLSSCRLRFEGEDLPFGGFPGANLSR